MEEVEASASPLNDNPTVDREQLDLIVSHAAAKSAVKDFAAAADLYSQATELQAGLNGPLSPENADLLFAYGKALYNVAISKSDVLGSKAAGQPGSGPSSAWTAKATPAGEDSGGSSVIQNAITSGVKKSVDYGIEELEEQVQKKPLFKFTGDEDFDGVDPDEDDEGGDEDEEEDDDFANAYETLDLARVLYLKKLGGMEEGHGEGKPADMPANIKQIKERLADTYDLQAEISLEAERFTDAVADLRKVLELRQALFPFEDPSVAECHYKLSLALEFASAKGEDEESGESEGAAARDIKKESITQMETAIESCKIRTAQEQKKLDDSYSTMDEDKITAAKVKISSGKEIIADMMQRLADLRQPQTLVKEQGQDNEAVLRGVLGQIMGQSPAEQRSKLDAANREARDLSAFVKRKPVNTGASPGEPTQKRPAETTQDGESKRVRAESPSQ